MSKPNIAEAATKIVDVLAPFETDERRRAVSAALLLLGDAGALPTEPILKSPVRGSHTIGGDFSPRVAAWVQHSGLQREQLEQVFHLDGEHVEVIASVVPGTTNKERTLNAYLLTGAARFLVSGDSTFTDQAARQLCRTLGCYNEANHATYMKGKGNTITGTKAQGWKLTAPGLTQAAHLIRQMTSAS